MNKPLLARKELKLSSIYVQTISLTAVHLNTIVSINNVDFTTEIAKFDDISAR